MYKYFFIGFPNILKGGAAVSAAPTKLLNTFYLIGALLALASGKAERRQVHPLVSKCYNLVGALETSAPLVVNVTNWLVHLRQVHPLVGECYKLVGALETSAPPCVI